MRHGSQIILLQVFVPYLDLAFQFKDAPCDSKLEPSPAEGS